MANQMSFTKATRKKSKLRLAVGGPSGSGKTTAALRIAKGLGGRTAVIDTERGSASLYSTDFDFDVLDLDPPYEPERFIEAIKAAEAAGYANVIVDSGTHVWDGSGGLLEANERLAIAKYKGNTWSAWSDTTPRYRAFIDAMLQSRLHVIMTMRSKTETQQGADKKVVKVGMKLEMRSGVEYEFTSVFELEHESHMAVPSKDRTRMFHQPFVITEATGTQLLAWLDSGEEAPLSEADIAAKRRDEISVRFARALNPEGDLGKTEEDHEAAIARSVFAVHSELKAFGIEEYQTVWNLIPAPSRAALKTYIAKAKDQQQVAA